MTLLKEQASSARCSIAGTTKPIPSRGWDTCARVQTMFTIAEEA